MTKDEILTLFDYTYWANHRLLEVVKTLSSEELNRVLLPGSNCIYDILVHSLGAEIMWWTRLARGTTLPAIPDRSHYASLEDVISRWETQENEMRSLLSSLSEADLAASFRYTNTRGNEYSTPRWQVLLQLVNHETQHRAEAAMLSTALGKSPGDLDFILYLRQR
ncbi:MAG TPA: DinB family protein [Anaerolinea sp.]|nr:DinB family protein [Anaerolinea sp.]